VHDRFGETGTTQAAAHRPRARELEGWYLTHRQEIYYLSPGVIVRIKLALEIIGTRRPNFRCHLPTAAWIVKTGGAEISYPHLRNAKLSDAPVIMGRVGGVPVLVDGWHRAIRAHRAGRTWLPAHLLSDAEFIRCCERSDHFEYNRERRK
jgi:hypothetical protein